ncbi:ATP-binding cassette domain-containing protein [Streptomyces collinus]|uniref:ATP-binding cassette domain-containing protein n=1 Tax=Streptomyces collinus TaxID=42684 RepID=UPI0005BCC723|nr:ATP-binding cassette domain-containing protein [Streptomyces collinus]UJA10910.1 ATP-binding cassette domain-containing protein [Streptomyces collinus]UJA14226.1 ATP-binding cassette domain-containing protein [Streptomyces collinus]
MIQAVGLTSIPRKAHPPVVDDVSFEACAGRVTALLGPAGAGKTTALRLMLELQQGRGITYFRGRPLHRIPHPAREVGVLLGDVPGHPARSVRGHLRMLCAAAGVPVRRADEVLEVVGLVSLREERLGTLSRGMDRRLGLACALLPDPHTLVLDDPTGGLSTREARWMHGMLRAHAAQGGTVLYTTADSKEAARAADRVVTLDGGRLVADQEAGEFARNRLRPRVAVRSPQAARLAVLLSKEARTAQRSVEVVREDGNRLSVYGSTTADIGETAFRHGILIHQLADEVGDMGAGAGAESRDVAAVAGEPATAVRERPVPERSSEGRTRAVLGSSAEGRPAGRAQAVSELVTGDQNPMVSSLVEVEPEAQAQSASDSAQASTSTSPSPSTTTSVPGEAEAEPTSAAVPDGAGGDASVGAAGASPTGDSRPAGTIPQTVPAEVSGGPAAAGGTAATGTHASGATVPGARNPSTRDPGSGRTRTGRPVPARAGAADTPEVLSTLPPPISPRAAPSPLRPLRYELRRAAGIGTGFLTCGAALVVSALTAVILARFGHTPQERLFAAWPRELPLPPAALAAGLLGALAFGDEFRHPALAADRGTVPRRLGLLTAKLVVSGATALLLAFLTLGCDAEVLYLVYGRELTHVPTDWLSLTASWFGLVTGCAWAGVLAAGVFRSATGGLAAVLAVPVLVVPAVHLTLGGSTVRTAAGLPARMRELLLLQWPFGGDRYLLATARVVAQPVGGALTLSLTALLCAYLAGTLRARAR